jgi:hypothetical protein
MTQSLKRQSKIDALENRFNEIHDALLKYLGPVEYGHAILSDKHPEVRPLPLLNQNRPHLVELHSLTRKYLKEASEARDEANLLRKGNAA